jgi:pentatricopeptide repeat protein
VDDYAAKINYLVNSGFEKDALKKYEEMIENSVSPNLDIFTDLIGMFAKKGDADQIKKFMLEMQINDVKATTNIYNMQIEMHLNRGNALKIII